MQVFVLTINDPDFETEEIVIGIFSTFEKAEQALLNDKQGLWTFNEELGVYTSNYHFVYGCPMEASISKFILDKVYFYD